MSNVNEADLRSFVDAVSTYFFQITHEKAEIRAAYLAEGDVAPTTFELTGYIKISGDFSGNVFFSAPRGMVSHLLVAMGELNNSDRQLLDAVGEIANTVAGNARKHFGEGMEISVPTTRLTDSTWLRTAITPGAYVIMIKWKHYRASIVVDIQRL